MDAQLRVKPTVRMRKITRKKVFTEFVESKKVNLEHGASPEWKCCNLFFTQSVDIYKHISAIHRQEVEERVGLQLTLHTDKQVRRKASNFETSECVKTSSSDSNHKTTSRRFVSDCNGKVTDSKDFHWETNHYSRREVTSVKGGDGKSTCLYTADDVFPWLPAKEKDEEGNRRDLVIQKRKDVIKVEKGGGSVDRGEGNGETGTKEQGNLITQMRENKKEGSNGDGEDSGGRGECGQVILFYKYTVLEDPEDICAWQRELCRRLELSGKIRIAKEGLNATVGGSNHSTRMYIQAVMAHPCFSTMSERDFKTSEGGRKSFPGGLVVSVHEEIVPMGISPAQVGFHDAGNHLTPSEFHEELVRMQKAKESGQVTDRILIDCRNFYESKIGTFNDAIRPDIRKFSYWPEYVDKNQELFADKTVLMYCTGGIRCERGSAYLKAKGICKDVLQLEGGIHRYMEQFPDGHFRGKLFVFDNRYSIQSNDDVISECVYCSKPWDQYQPCSSPNCFQLVLSCSACRKCGLTSCCLRCCELPNQEAMSEEGSKHKKKKEECSCTMNRERIPTEKLDSR